MYFVYKSEIHRMNYVLLDFKIWIILLSLFLFYFVMAFVRVSSNGDMTFCLLNLMANGMTDRVELLDITDLANSWSR